MTFLEALYRVHSTGKKRDGQENVRRVLWSLYHFLRVQRTSTTLLGRPYRPNKKLIEVDITYHCNLSCSSCNRSCGRAPSDESISAAQFRKFIDDCVNTGSPMERIRLLGGEPSLHHELSEILDLLLEYKKHHAPAVQIVLGTNGLGRAVKSVLSKLPKEVIIENSEKKSAQQSFVAFNSAPQDSPLYKYADYSNGCFIQSICGIGFTPYGYYPCAVAGSIDRVFGFNLGRKSFPKPDDNMRGQLQIFCRLCGHFRTVTRTLKGKVSPTWEKSYEKYHKRKPVLSLY